MGHAWIYLGEANIPDAERAAWLVAVPPYQAYAELLGHPDLRPWNLYDPDPEVYVSQESVGDVLDALSEEDGAFVNGTDGAIVVRVVADKSSDAWLSYRGLLVRAFVALHAHGGRGTLSVVGYEGDPNDGGFRVVSAEQGVTVECLDARAVTELRESTAYQEAAAAYEAAMAEEWDDDE